MNSFLLIISSFLSLVAMDPSSETKSLNSEWRKRVASSPEAKEAREELGFHQTKVRKLTEELNVAEDWEKELERRLKAIEDKVKPPLLKIAESFENSNEVEDSFLEAAINEEDHERLLTMMRKKALAMDKMDRAQLLAFVKTLLSVRNCLVEKEQDRGVEMMQRMASGVLSHLGRVSIDWLEVSEWEAGLLRRLISQVEGVPPFLARMVDQFLVNIVNNSSMN